MMNDIFLQSIDKSTEPKGIIKPEGIGDNPHLHQLQLLTSQVHGSMKNSPGLINAASLLNSSIGASGNGLKDNLSIEESMHLLNDHLLTSSAGTTLNSASSINSSASLNGLNNNSKPQTMDRSFLSSILNSSADYYPTQFCSDDNQVNSHDQMLNYDYSIKNSYPLSPTLTSTCDQTFHSFTPNLTSNQLTNYHNQIQTNSFLNNSINSLNSNPLLNLQGYPALLSDEPICSSTFDASMNLTNSLHLSNQTSSTFHNLQNLEPLATTSINSNNLIETNHLNQMANSSPLLNSSVSSNNQTTNISTDSAQVSVDSATTTQNSVKISKDCNFTQEQLNLLLNALHTEKNPQNLAKLLSNIKLNRFASSNDNKNENGGQENSQFNNSLDMHYRPNSHYSNGQPLALSTITGNVYNNMHQVYNTQNGNLNGNNQIQSNQTNAEPVKTALDAFYLHQLPFDRQTNELILLAKATVEFHKPNFKNLYKILEENEFSGEHHKRLQSLWNNGHYKESQLQKPKALCAVDKYRLRKKFRFPLTIWDGEETVYCFKESSRQELLDFYLTNPYVFE